MNLFIQDSAEQDILQQVEWYAEKGLAIIARRFSAASVKAIAALMLTPEAGPPKPVANPQLVELRTWPIKGFDEFRIYYLLRPGMVIILRILHSKRNTDAIIEGQGVDDPDLQ